MFPSDLNRQAEDGNEGLSDLVQLLYCRVYGSVIYSALASTLAVLGNPVFPYPLAGAL